MMESDHATAFFGANGTVVDPSRAAQSTKKASKAIP